MDAALVQRAGHDCVQPVAVMNEIFEYRVPLWTLRKLIGALDERPELLN